MSSINITRQDLERPELHEEIISLLGSSPSVNFVIISREDLEGFVRVVTPNQKGYLGRKISCKHAQSNMPMNYFAKEIYLFSNEKYPIELSFKTIEDLEDFALGYNKASITIPAPTPTTGNTIEEKVVQPSKSFNPVQQTTAKSSIDDSTVNRKAESFLNTVLIVLKVFSWVVAIGFVLTSIINIVIKGHFAITLGGIIGAGLILLYYYLIWAVFKVFLNMSNNLFGIREDLRSLKKN